MSQDDGGAPEGLFLRGKKYYFYYYTPGTEERKQQATGYGVGEEPKAVDFRKRFLARLDAEREVLVATGQPSGEVTAALYLEKWCQDREVNVRIWDRRSEVRKIRMHVIPRLRTDENGHSLLLTNVRPRHIRQMVLSFIAAGKHAPRTIRAVFFLTRMAFGDAVADELIPTNPCVLKKGQLPAKRDKDPTRRAIAYYTVKQCEALLSDPLVPFHRRAMWAFLIFTGARFGEMAAVQWLAWERDLEPLGRLLLFRSYNYEYKVVKETKTEAIKEVPVHPELVKILSEWELRGWPELMGRQPQPEDLMFPIPKWRERDPAALVHNKKIDAEEAERMLGAGASYGEIAARFGCTPHAVSSALKRLRARRAHPPAPEAVERSHGEFRDHVNEMYWFKRACKRLRIAAKRQHDFRSTFLTLLTEADADEPTVNIMTHAPRLEDAPGLYRRYTWKKRCREILKHPVVIRMPETYDTAGRPSPREAHEPAPSADPEPADSDAVLMQPVVSSQLHGGFKQHSGDLVPEQGRLAMVGAASLAVGAAASAVVAAGARARGSLSTSGAVAATAVGTAVWAGGGPPWFAVLATFFVTSTLLGRVGARRKAAVKREFEKGDRRDAWQVLANGGAAAVAALAAAAGPGPASARWAHAFVAALAAANADTWATELGVLSRGEPWSLVRLRRVPRGTSGAVSPLGLTAALAGAAIVGAVAAFSIAPAARTLLVAVAFGVAGALVDSLLGATVQTRYWCAGCAREAESDLHHCGTQCARSGGLPAFGNDAVNAAATIAAALAAYLLVP